MIRLFRDPFSWCRAFIWCMGIPSAMFLGPVALSNSEDWYYPITDPAAPYLSGYADERPSSARENGGDEWPNGETQGERSEAEPEGEIETDRDSFTPSTATVESQRLVVEAAYSFIDGQLGDTHSVPESLLRYGLNDWFELRLGWNNELGVEPNVISSGSGTNGADEEGANNWEGQVSYGSKFLLSNQDRYLPRSSFILMAAAPTTSSSESTQLITTYAFGWLAKNGVRWDSSIRYGFGREEHDAFNTWAPSTVVKYPLGKRWDAHAEYFGVFSDGRADERTLHFFSPGVHYLLDKDYEVGVRVGWGLNDQSPDYFLNVGFGCQY